ncbi:hypothetical protein T492DRAFT_1089355, partial [Pavlovales sp. CCMP2436]
MALTHVDIASENFQMDRLPLAYCQSWPLWCAEPNDRGGQTLRHVNPSFGDDEATAASGMWVDPITFEELWLPSDLPVPSFHLSLILVLKDGVPRYLCPAVDSTVEAGGRDWRNRGLKSVPMPKLWLPYRHLPISSMRISAYVQPAAQVLAAGEMAMEPPHEPLTVMLPVDLALEAAAQVLAEAPEDLATGFAYLSVRLPLDNARLDNALLQPGARLRVFLSDADEFPLVIDAQTDEWAWERGELDIRLTQVSAGGTSEYLPEV